MKKRYIFAILIAIGPVLGALRGNLISLVYLLILGLTLYVINKVERANF